MDDATAQHDFANASVLLSAVHGNYGHLRDGSNTRSNHDEPEGPACLWLSSLPQTGVRPGRTSSLEWVVHLPMEQDIFTFNCEDIQPIYPEASFWLPRHVDDPYTAYSETEEGWPEFDRASYTFGSQRLQITRPSDDVDTSSGLALFSAYGLLVSNRREPRESHIQCCTIIQVPALLALWQNAIVSDKIDRKRTAAEDPDHRTWLHHFRWASLSQ